MQRYFHGVRSPRGCEVSVQCGAASVALDPRFDLRKHSPDGFEWGYGGSGPAQLSLALCAEVLQDDAQALAIYQQFKATVTCFLKGNTWCLPESKLKSVTAGLLASDQAKRRLLELLADKINNVQSDPVGQVDDRPDVPGHPSSLLE